MIRRVVFLEYLKKRKLTNLEHMKFIGDQTLSMFNQTSKVRGTMVE